MDIEDTVETYRLRRALSLVGENLHALLASFATGFARTRHVCMAFTHLQPAEPTTRGTGSRSTRRIAESTRPTCGSSSDSSRAKGFAARLERRVVRTTARPRRTLGEIEAEVLAAFGLESREISTQTYPRKLDYLLLSALAGLGLRFPSSLPTFAS